MSRKAVLFDLFGTLVNTVSPADYETMVASVAEALGADRSIFLVQWRSEIEVRESGGLGDVEAILESTARRAGHEPSEDAVAHAADVWLGYARRWLEPRERTLETIRAFHDAGYRTGLVSNCSAEVPRLWPETPFSSHIEAPVFSWAFGMMKPSPAIYLEAARLLDVAPQGCLFVGDGGARELTGAEAVGMRAVLLRVAGEEHTWFDSHYRRDALEWRGESVTAIGQLTGLISP